MRAKRWLHNLTVRKMVIHTKDNRSLEGFHVGTYQDGIVLHQARYLDSGNPVELPGETFVPRDNVSFLQAPEDGH